MLTTTVDPVVQARFNQATEQVRRFLHPVPRLSAEEARQIIRRYTAAIGGNFLAWMSAASVAARSVLGRYAASENLVVELHDDHPGMLHRFAQTAGAEPCREDFAYVDREVVAVRRLVSLLSGIQTLCLMGILESTSAAFIPHLAALATKLESSDFLYTNVHGEADIAHAEQFVAALSDELQWDYRDPQGEIEQTVDAALNLLRKIFTLPQAV